MPPAHLTISPVPCHPPAASAEVRAGVGRRLLAVAALLEDEFGGAQVGRPRGCRGCCFGVCMAAAACPDCAMVRLFL